jgi:hypothetical protein
MATFADASQDIAYADNNVGTQGTPNDFISDGVIAITSVNTPLNKLQITHDFHPSASLNLYEVIVTLSNIGEDPFTDLIYRRVMDWDIYPTVRFFHKL